MQVKTDHGIKLTGFYRGQVIQHLKNGKCKIFIPGVYPDTCLVDPGQVPDAEQASPLFGGVNEGNGCFSYPNINSIVWCFFENGDQNFPVYFASTLGGEMPNKIGDEGFNVARDNVSPSDDPAKDTTKTGTDAQTHMINCGDSRIIIRESGQIEIIVKNPDKNGNTENDKSTTIFMDGDGTLKIDSSSVVQISSPAIKINAGDQLEINTGVLKIRANTEMTINAPHFVNRNENSHTVKSPAINMDATEGKFTAQGATHAPITAF